MDLNQAFAEILMIVSIIGFLWLTIETFKPKKKMTVQLAQPNDYYVFVLSEVTHEYEFKKVEGKPLKLPGFEENDLFLYVHTYEDATGWEDSFRVSCGITGCTINFGGHEDEAISEAITTLKHKGVQALHNSIERQVKKYGVCPRYKLINA